jgi:hypothetical protein
LLEKAAFKLKLKTALPKTHLPVDCWSSPNRKNFQAICAHFVDESRVLRKALLALPYLPDGHGGEHQASELVKVLDEYGILDRIGYCTGDNHGSNDLMLRELSKDLSKRGIKYDPVQRQIRCHGHVVNIAVQAFLFAKDEEAVEAAFKGAVEALAIDEDCEDIELDRTLATQFKEATEAKWREFGGLGKIHNLSFLYVARITGSIDF